MSSHLSDALLFHHFKPSSLPRDKCFGTSGSKQKPLHSKIIDPQPMTALICLWLSGGSNCATVIMKEELRAAETSDYQCL